METNAALFADRNDPFVCMCCLPPKSLDVWKKDARVLEEVTGNDATFSARVAAPNNKTIDD